MINLNNLNIILTGATGVIGNSILDKLILAGSNVLATGTNDEKLKIIKDKYKDLNVIKFNIAEHKKIDQFVNQSPVHLSLDIDVLDKKLVPGTGTPQVLPHGRVCVSCQFYPNIRMRPQVQ